MRKIKLFTIIFSILLVSCSTSLDFALDYAGENRRELESVLEYFAKKKDAEELAAAKYIISNMPGHRSMYGKYNEYFDDVDSLFDAGLSASNAYQEIRDISDSYGSQIGYGYDSKIIESKYLISNIENAIHYWRNGHWASHLNFDQFCEWLLPYTCSSRQPLDSWRTDLEPFAKGYIDELHVCDDYKGNPRDPICRINDKLIKMIETQKWTESSYGHPISRPETFVKLPGANCEEYAEIAVRIMRSKGIPVGIDFTPQWPDRLNGHYWCVYPNLRGKTTMFNPFASNPDYPHFVHAEFARVYRRTYAPNQEYLKLLRRNKGDVPAMFADVFFTDVTDEYMKTADIKIKLQDGIRLSNNDVYIAVFDNHKWSPVAWGKAYFGKAHFKGMGRRITYIILGYVKDELIPISNPFYLDDQGQVNEFIIDENHNIDIRMWRKYPMFQHVFNIHKLLHGGYVEASGDPDFSVAERVSSFPEWSMTSGCEYVTQSKPYRYWRFCADEDKVCDMAELFFFDKDSSRIYPVTASSLNDNDMLTNYSAEGAKLKEHIDFGSPVSINHISYVRRGDGNAIMPGEQYDIYYWADAKWNHHSSHTAKDIYLDVTDLPSGTLYYIKGYSGQRYRIFTINPDSHTVEWR